MKIDTSRSFYCGVTTFMLFRILALSHVLNFLGEKLIKCAMTSSLSSRVERVGPTLRAEDIRDKILAFFGPRSDSRTVSEHRLFALAS